MAFLDEHSPQHLCEPQLDDPTIGLVLQAVEKDERLNPDTIVCGGPEVRCLIQLWDRLLVEEGVLKQKYDSIRGNGSWTQFVVPRVLRVEILQELHAGSLEGHLGRLEKFGSFFTGQGYSKM